MKTRHTISKLFTSVVFLVLVLTSCAPGVKTCRLAESMPLDHLTTKADLKFAELVKAKSNGRIQIQVFPNEEIGEEIDAYHMVKDDTLEFARTNIAIMSDISEYSTILLFPYLFENKDHLWATLNSPIGAAFYNDLRSANIEPLAYLDNGVRCIYTTTPVTKISDMAGLKFRVFKSKILEDAFFKMGTNPVPLSFGEVKRALEVGTIDGAENNLTSFYTSGHYKNAKYFLNDQHIIMPDLLYMNKKFFNSLTDEERGFITDAAKEASEYQRAEWASYEEQVSEILRAEGCVFSQPADINEFRRIADELLQDDYPQYTEIIQQIKEIKH